MSHVEKYGSLNTIVFSTPSLAKAYLKNVKADGGTGRIIHHGGKYIVYHKRLLKIPNTRRNNGRSYVTKGVSIGIPRYSFDPKTGDKFYVEGKLITIKRVDGEGMLHFSPSVDGTFAMSAGNLYQMARVPEDSRFAPYEYRIKRVPNGRLVPARIRHKGHTYSGKVKRVNGRVKIFVTHEVARKINPHQHTGLKIVPVTKERFTRQVRPLLRAPYNLMPFALYKRTIGKGMYMLFRGTEFLKAGTKSQLKKWAKPAPSGHRVGTPYI